MTNLGHPSVNATYPPGLKLIVIGALMVCGMILVMDMSRQGSLGSDRQVASDCQGEVNQDVTISKEQLAQFLTIPVSSTKASIQDVLQRPYCHLAPIEVRAGTTSERFAYRLAFRPQMWLIVLYEGEAYTDFDFRVE